MDDDLIRRLCDHDRFPATPETASRMIVEELLSDLPLDRQAFVMRVIEEWASERENAVSSTISESFRG